MFKDILVALSGLSGEAQAVDDGVRLARAFDSHLLVVETMFVPVPLPSAWGVPPDEWIMQQLRDQQRAAAEARAARWRARLEREALSHTVRIVEATHNDGSHLASQARHADLVIVPRADPALAGFGFVERFFSSLLFESGRPVLLAPAETRLMQPPRHVVIGWQTGREAARALHDALPLLRMAGSVDVLEVRPWDGAADPGADIAAHLARHGVKARVVVHHERTSAVPDALLRHCEQSGADLLVCGGYGHSRLREWMLGGTTRELVRSTRRPVLFSH